MKKPSRIAAIAQWPQCALTHILARILPRILACMLICLLTGILAGLLPGMPACIPAFPLTMAQAAEPAKYVHIVVALCDNKNQGIVPVPAKIGNGFDPDANLYWGAMYGVRTFFKKQPEWHLDNLVKDKNALPDKVLERAVFTHKNQRVIIVADAYQGDAMYTAIEDFYASASGSGIKNLEAVAQWPHLASKEGGGPEAAPELTVFVGHNGLMDFIFSFSRPEPPKSTATQGKRQAAVLACQSRSYFAKPLALTGATPILLTNGNMAPEAYSVHALITAWLAGKKGPALKEEVAAAYHKYQKCGLKAARNLFSTPE